MALGNRQEHLAEDVGCRFLAIGPALHPLEQLASSAELHNEINLLVIYKTHE